jgi:tetratricopeptide (TPR) repeat protein
MTEALARSILIAVALALTACETAPDARKPASPMLAEPVYEPEPGLTPRERLLRALERLEEGDAERARVEVIAYLERVPRSAIAQDLLLQIDTDPAVYYPPSYQEVILQAGQSLSNVAKNYLGSAYEFYALARYNDIQRPKRVVPGQIVKVPLTPEAVEAFEREIGAGEEPEVDGSTAVEVLADDDTVSEELDEADVADSLPAPAQPAEKEMPGMPVEEEVDAVVDVSAPTPMDVSATEEAVEPKQPAIDADALHREAINAYRSQDLDRAIELWDEILAAEPGYESARLYRSQAIALKERLQRLQ